MQTKPPHNEADEQDYRERFAVVRHEGGLALIERTENRDHEDPEIVGPAVLAEASTMGELADETREMMSKYRLYFHDFGLAEPHNLVGVYETLEGAKDKMFSISYDLDCSLHFWIETSGDEVTWGSRPGWLEDGLVEPEKGVIA